jgi:hypothetical protein
MKIRCARCKKPAELSASHVNRSRANGMKLYCSRRCAGMAHRKGKTKAQRVAEKKAYDENYRKTSTTLKARRHAHHLKNYDPVKEAVRRKKTMPQHVEYCRQPWYKKWKSEYDARYRAKEFGAFADAYRLTLELNREIKRRITNGEIKWQNQTSNKAQFRRRGSVEKERSRNDRKTINS